MDSLNPPDTAAATDTDWTATDTYPAAAAMDTVTMITIEEAARIASVSVRTIRRWVQLGHLAAVEGETGKLVSPADLPGAQRRASRGHGRGHRGAQHGHDRGHDNTVTDADTAMSGAALSSSATAQMEAIRDQWLRPLVDRIEELSRENGRLEHERDSLRSQLAEKQTTRGGAPQDAMKAPPRDVPPVMASETHKPSADTLALRWRRWFRRMTGSG